MNDSNNSSSKTNALIKGTLIYAIGNLGTKILNFLIVPLYTFFIEPEALGNYDLLITTVSLLSPILTLRISEAAYRWRIKEEKKPAKAKKEDLSTKTLTELKELAKEKGIKGYSKLKKDELLEVLK